MQISSLHWASRAPRFKPWVVLHNMWPYKTRNRFKNQCTFLKCFNCLHAATFTRIFAAHTPHLAEHRQNTSNIWNTVAIWARAEHPTAPVYTRYIRSYIHVSELSMTRELWFISSSSTFLRETQLAHYYVHSLLLRVRFMTVSSFGTSTTT